ncbi:Hsp20/alpha crystallin family protein [Citricoccus sp. GCM10030269]|uniref:Hsp20/alpha crystallin family protein n=1 Tax=Citricoccus sp. GCM10030269 TaxID=3273388 RepID=UPI00361CD549
MATRIDPFRELDRLAGQLLTPVRGLRQMPMDLYKDGNTYVVEADLPGVDPSSVDVDVDGQLLTIRAERKPAVADNESVMWMTRERETGNYVRQLNLGQDVDFENISANYDHGVLKVTIPVSAKAQPRKIKVGTGNGAQAVQPTSSSDGSGSRETISGESTPAAVGSNS